MQLTRVENRGCPLLVSVYKGYVFGVPMKSRRGQDYVQAYKDTFNHFAKFGQVPDVQRMDNETSGALERSLEDKKVRIQYVPPHNHRANKAERAIRDFKSHLIATLGTI